jgi:hypothetical protein
MLNICGFKKRRVEIRNFLKNFFTSFRSSCFRAKNLKKQAVQVVIVFEFCQVEKFE